MIKKLIEKNNHINEVRNLKKELKLINLHFKQAKSFYPDYETKLNSGTKKGYICEKIKKNKLKNVYDELFAFETQYKDTDAYTKGIETAVFALYHKIDAEQVKYYNTIQDFSVEL